MSPRKTKAGPPQGEPASAQVLAQALRDGPSVPRPPAWAAAKTPVFVLLVQYPTTVRRRSFLTLSAAERHAERAQEKGHRAEVVLCRVVPMTEPEISAYLANQERFGQPAQDLRDLEPATSTTSPVVPRGPS